MKPTKDFFVGIDSDGCVFDSMGIKQRECFCPLMIGYFDLQHVALAARECKEFADLFSKTRGATRHITIVRILRELLPSHPLVKELGAEIPSFPYFCEWVDNPDSLLSDAGLQQIIDTTDNAEQKAELSRVLKWSQRVNELVAEIVANVPPIPFVRESLDKISQNADVIVCSSTPYDTIVHEWETYDIAKYVDVIAGQEMGKKHEHLDYASSGRYQKNHVLMIGDAPGDRKAAETVGALFYPINPGHEIESWKRLFDEAFDRFLNLDYAGEYQQALIDEFEGYLPENPPWLS